MKVIKITQNEEYIPFVNIELNKKETRELLEVLGRTNKCFSLYHHLNKFLPIDHSS